MCEAYTLNFISSTTVAKIVLEHGGNAALVSRIRIQSLTDLTKTTTKLKTLLLHTLNEAPRPRHFTESNVVTTIIKINYNFYGFFPKYILAVDLMSKNIFLTQSIKHEYFHDEQSTISRVNIE